MIRLAMTIAFILQIIFGMLHKAHAEAKPMLPDLRQEFPAPAKKTIRNPQPPCLAGTIQILGGWVIRDRAGNIVAIGMLRRRC